MRLIPGLVAAAMLSACSAQGTLRADRAWVRLPAVAGQPGAAYFTVHGGARADTLLSVTTHAALRAELHENMKGDHAMMTMAPLKDVAVPAGSEVAFAPGGRHVMLFSIGPAVKPGGNIPLELAFAGGRTLVVEAQVIGAGDAEPN